MGGQLDGRELLLRREDGERIFGAWRFEQVFLGGGLVLGGGARPGQSTGTVGVRREYVR